MEKLKPPFPWFGGKSRAAPMIWHEFGDVPNYVEPFAGSLATLLQRPTEPGIETVTDKDHYIANFWRALQADPDAVAVAADWPVSEVDLTTRHLWLVKEGAKKLQVLMATPDGYDAKIAGWWVWGLGCWIGGGWCSGKGAWDVVDGQWENLGDGGVTRQKPFLSTVGQGIRRQGVNRGKPGLWCDRGVHRKGKNLLEYMKSLANRLRDVRICCGDWTRILTPTVTWKQGITGILLDPPYGCGNIEYAAGGNSGMDIATRVREWAIANGNNQLLRIALCGYEGQFTMPEEWREKTWTHIGKCAKENKGRERIWFSPHCLGQTDITEWIDKM